MTSIVRSCVAPTGPCTCANMIPWSSAGRKAVGMRRKSTTITAAMARNAAKKRFGRLVMPRTDFW